MTSTTTPVEQCQRQLDELECMKAIYPDEFTDTTDAGTLETLKGIVDGETQPDSRHEDSLVSFCVKIMIDKGIDLSVNFTLPPEFPDKLALVYLRSDALTRAEVSAINKAFSKETERVPEDFVTCMTMIQWFEDNAQEIVSQLRSRTNETTTCDEKDADASDDDNVLQRVYIKFHHLYSSWKRKVIVHEAGQHALGGFSMPGKPGVLIVEGDKKNVKDYMAVIRKLSWQKMSLRHSETWTSSDDRSSAEGLKFDGKFAEIAFHAHGHDFKHPDLSSLKSFLEDRGLGHAYSILLGL